MSAVVILSWDPSARELEYVSVNGGAGDAAQRVTVREDDAIDVSVQLAGLTLPKLAELEAADGIVLIDAVSPAEVVRCAVTATGRSGDRKFKFRDKERRVAIADQPIAALGVADEAQANAISNRLEYLYAGQLDPPGCWLGCAGGIETWLADERRAARQKEREERLREARRHWADETRFVNPYTFVPFPEAIQREPPGGHHRLKPGRLSGRLTVTWTFTSPFQAPAGASGTTVLRLPGASVKGAVRSVHETLAGGCLRVFDADYIPSYRDHAQVRRSDWTLAVVEDATDDGQPLSVTLCDEVVWVGVTQLRRARKDTLATGDRVTIQEADVPPGPNKLGRKELDESAVVTSGGDWVVLVTDSGTRREEIVDPDTGEKREGAYLLACGRLRGRSAEVTEAAWRAFRIAAAGARDMQPSAREDAAGSKASGHEVNDQELLRPTAPVSLGGRAIGDRRVVTGRLWPGDVVWARTGTAGARRTVDELSLAALWRHPGWDSTQQPESHPEKWAAGSRVPPALLGCRDPQDLCPSCRIFGSVDQQTRDAQDRARQRAYAGHVRFGDACSEEPVQLTEIHRAPLGAPRPGAGQFYLSYEDDSPAREGRKPTREWGADPDREHRRPLRGRKFYWHADPTEQESPRHLARGHQRGRTAGGESKLVSTRHLAPAGTVLRQRVTFDNLSRAELGSLLAAFEPHRVLSPAPAAVPLVLHLGGGKPLGLGSCTAAIGELRVWSAASRYGEAPEESPDADGYLREFADGCAAALRDAVWPSLAAVLARETVNPARVWYPPGEYWTEQSRSQKKFDEPFDFFTASSGMHIKQGEPRRLIPLPHPAEGDQSLPILRREDLR